MFDVNSIKCAKNKRSSNDYEVEYNDDYLEFAIDEALHTLGPKHEKIL